MRGSTHPCRTIHLAQRARLVLSVRGPRSSLASHDPHASCPSPNLGSRTRAWRVARSGAHARRMRLGVGAAQRAVRPRPNPLDVGVRRVSAILARSKPPPRRSDPRAALTRGPRRGALQAHPPGARRSRDVDIAVTPRGAHRPRSTPSADLRPRRQQPAPRIAADPAMSDVRLLRHRAHLARGLAAAQATAVRTRCCGAQRDHRSRTLHLPIWPDRRGITDDADPAGDCRAAREASRARAGTSAHGRRTESQHSSRAVLSLPPAPTTYS